MKSHRFPITVYMAGIIISASVAGCNKPSSQPITETAPEPHQPSTVAATPAPPLVAPIATPPPATPQPNYLAPEGVFFVIVATSVTTNDGITGLPPGTRAIKQTDGRYLAEGHLVELRPDQVTNDLRVAARIAGADQAAQAQIRQASASEAKDFQRQQQEQAQQQTASQQAMTATNAQAAARRQAKIAAIRKKIADARRFKEENKIVHGVIQQQDTKIRLLQQELSAMGVPGAALE